MVVTLILDLMTEESSRHSAAKMG